MSDFDPDSPSWPAYILVAAILAFLLWVLADVFERPPETINSIPPAVYVVGTLP